MISFIAGMAVGAVITYAVMFFRSIRF